VLVCCAQEHIPTINSCFKVVSFGQNYDYEQKITGLKYRIWNLESIPLTYQDSGVDRGRKNWGLSWNLGLAPCSPPFDFYPAAPRKCIKALPFRRGVSSEDVAADHVRNRFRLEWSARLHRAGADGHQLALAPLLTSRQHNQLTHNTGLPIKI